MGSYIPIFPHYALKSWDEDKIVIAEQTWANVRSKGLRVCLVATFVSGWVSIVKEAGKQTLKYGGRKALGAVSGCVCGYFGSASIVLLTNSVKLLKFGKACHSICAGGLDILELASASPIHVLEIFIFGRPALLDIGDGFDLFQSGSSVVDDK